MDRRLVDAREWLGKDTSHCIYAERTYGKDKGISIVDALSKNGARVEIDEDEVYRSDVTKTYITLPKTTKQLTDLLVEIVNQKPKEASLDGEKLVLEWGM